MIRFHIFLIAVLCLCSVTLSAQVFYQESFESETGWTLSHSFDSGTDEYSERETSDALLELGYTLFGVDGSYVIAAEDTDGLTGESPEDGLIELELGSVDISGQSNIELVLSLSCNASDEAYDDRSLSNGDYLDVQVRIDGGLWTTIGSFCSRAGGTSISTLYHDLDMDGDGGELGELPVVEAMRDFAMPVGDVGSSAVIRLRYRMNGNAEVLVLDNVRLRQSPGDDTPPRSIFRSSCG